MVIKSVYKVYELRDNTVVTEETEVTKEQAKRIGRMIATARRNKSWSLRRLSTESGISPPWLLKLERGEYTTPAPERLIRVADALHVDPERIERIVKGQISENLPGVRTYFRAKFDLSAEEIDEIERTVTEIQRNHERRDTHDDHSDTT
jgi:transcriptional regulator with XRE-family HTH domain